MKRGNKPSQLICLFQHVHQSVSTPLPAYPSPAGHSVVWIVFPITPFSFISTVSLFRDLFLPSLALFSSAHAPSLHSHLQISIVTLLSLPPSSAAPSLVRQFPPRRVLR